MPVLLLTMVEEAAAGVKVPQVTAQAVPALKVLLFLPITQDQLLPTQQQEH